MSIYNPYRWCVALNCKNSTLKTPEKLFISIPNDVSVRYVWLELAGRDPTIYSEKSHLYLCEDHFDLQQDMVNYMQYKIMGSVKKIRMKSNSIPSKFSHMPIATASKEMESTAASVPPALATPYNVLVWQPSLCRCCLRQPGEYDLGQLGNKMLRHTLAQCFGVELSHLSDGVEMRMICSDCANTLQNAHSFRQQAMKAEQKFKEYMHKEQEIYESLCFWQDLSYQVDASGGTVNTGHTTAQKIINLNHINSNLIIGALLIIISDFISVFFIIFLFLYFVYTIFKNVSFKNIRYFIDVDVFLLKEPTVHQRG